MNVVVQNTLQVKYATNFDNQRLNKKTHLNNGDVCEKYNHEKLSSSHRDVIAYGSSNHIVVAGFVSIETNP